MLIVVVGPVMASEGSGDESAFTDCVTSGAESRVDTPAGRRRQVSVPEMIRRAESRQSKRPAPDRGSKSPRDPAVPAAKRPPAEPAEPLGGVELSASALAAIRQMLNTGIASVISAFEAKFESMERRLSILESEVMDKDNEIQRLGNQLAHQIQVSESLQAQVESMDINRRLASLIFTCDDFGRRSAGEDIEEKVVRLLNERIQGLNLTPSDIHAAHRLQRDDKVIVKFMKRSVRDRIYDARFSLTTHRAGTAGHRSGPADASGSHGGYRLSTLYITESLTAYNQSIYNQLLQVRRTSGGTKVASVFSRRGLVFCRTVKGGPNIRVPDVAALRRIVGDVGAAPSGGPRRGPVGRGSDASPPVGTGASRPAALQPGGAPAVRELAASGAPAVLFLERQNAKTDVSTRVESNASASRTALVPPVSVAAEVSDPAGSTVAAGSPSVVPAAELPLSAATELPPVTATELPPVTATVPPPVTAAVPPLVAAPAVPLPPGGAT